MGEDPGGCGAGRIGSAHRDEAGEEWCAVDGAHTSTEGLVEAWGRRLLARRPGRPVGVEPTSNRRRRASLGLVVAAAVLLLSGCQPGGWVARLLDPAGNPVTHHCGSIPWSAQAANPADPMFRANVISVIGEIQRMTGRRFTEVPYQQARIRVTESWPATNTHPGYTSVTSDGWHFTVNTVYINPRATQPNSVLRLGVLRHELGHAMGLDHTPADPSIMNPARFRSDYSAEVDIPALQHLATHC
jgi:hypothetical protein